MLSHRVLFLGLALVAVFYLMGMAGPAIGGTADSAAGALAEGPEGVHFVGQWIEIRAMGQHWADAAVDADNGNGRATGFTHAHLADPLLGNGNSDVGGEAALIGWAHGDVGHGTGVWNGKWLEWQDIGQYQSSRWAVSDALAEADPPGIVDRSHDCKGCDHHNNHQPFVYNYEVRRWMAEALVETPSDLFGEVLLPGERSQ